MSLSRGWKNLSVVSVARELRWPTVIWVFSASRDVDSCWRLVKQAAVAGEVLKTDGVSSVYKVGNFAVKETRGMTALAFKHSLVRFDRVSGYLGVLGEALNTVQVNQRHLPAHELMCVTFNLLTLKSAAYYNFLNDYVCFEDILSSQTTDLLSLLDASFLLLEKMLVGGVYHGDVNISNQFFTPDLLCSKLIDFEVSRELDCSLAMGFALQCSSMWDFRLKPYIEYTSYQSKVLGKIRSLSKDSADYNDSARLFNLMTAKSRVPRRLRDARLLIACGDMLASDVR